MKFLVWYGTLVIWIFFFVSYLVFVNYKRLKCVGTFWDTLYMWIVETHQPSAFEMGQGPWGARRAPLFFLKKKDKKRGKNRE